MGLTKYQKVEKVEIVSPEEHKKIEAGLRKINKTSARELTSEERQKLFDAKH